MLNSVYLRTKLWYKRSISRFTFYVKSNLRRCRTKKSEGHFVYFLLPPKTPPRNKMYRQRNAFMISMFLEKKIDFFTSKWLIKGRRYDHPVKGKNGQKKSYRDTHTDWSFTAITTLRKSRTYISTYKAMLASHERPIKYNYSLGSSWALEKVGVHRSHLCIPVYIFPMIWK